MKIGLIGNMNNNNFSLMRYLRNLGYDSYLILLDNEVKGNSNHFNPEADTWNINKWNNYIIKSKIYEDPISVFKFPSSLFFMIKSLFDFFRGRGTIKLPTSDKYIFKVFSKYDILIGSGLTPSILNRVNLKLDIFFPYSFGVEWVGNPIFDKKVKSKNPIKKYFAKKIKIKQLTGLRNTKKIISSFDELTFKTLNDNNLELSNSLFPMVYNLEKIKNPTINKLLSNTLSILKKTNFSILSHSRHVWVNKNNFTKKDWKKFNKNNDWIIISFHKFISHTRSKNIKLILFEYGEDFNETKKLCNDLGLKDFIIWLPKMKRKEIMLLISSVDVCIGEFYELKNMLFGGTGYEVLASGKPFIQSFNFDESDFKHKFNTTFPPVLNANNTNEIFNHFINLYNNNDLRNSLGTRSAEWFNKNCGIDLANKIIKSVST